MKTDSNPSTTLALANTLSIPGWHENQENTISKLENPNNNLKITVRTRQCQVEGPGFDLFEDKSPSAFLKMTYPNFLVPKFG